MSKCDRCDTEGELSLITYPLYGAGRRFGRKLSAGIRHYCDPCTAELMANLGTPTSRVNNATGEARFVSQQSGRA